MFDSPFAYCARCGEMVLLDQTRWECAAEHQCGECECSLAGSFSGFDFRTAESSGEMGHEGEQERRKHE